LIQFVQVVDRRCDWCKRRAKMPRPARVSAARTLRPFYKRLSFIAIPIASRAAVQALEKLAVEWSRCWHGACDGVRAGRREHWVRSALPWTEFDNPARLLHLFSGGLAALRKAAGFGSPPSPWAEMPDQGRP